MPNDIAETGEVAATQRPAGLILTAFLVLTRVAGLLLLIVGIVTMTRVVFEAWELYEAPNEIVRFAEAIERGSNIDKVLLPRNRSGSADAASGEQRYLATGDDLRPSYFLAWILAVPLLLSIGMLSLWATRAGAELTAYGWTRSRSRR